MTPRADFVDHVITVIRDETREYPATANDDGDLILNENCGETIDIGSGTTLLCDECGPLAVDELLNHGISPDWSEA